MIKLYVFHAYSVVFNPSALQLVFYFDFAEWSNFFGFNRKEKINVWV